MPTFTPPIVSDRPAILPETRGEQRGLYRFMKNRQRYINVFKLSNGTYVQDTVSTENANTNIPYPWNPSNPGGPFVEARYYDYTAGQYVNSTTSKNPYIVTWYSGATVISAAEATALTAAGYGGRIS